ncbi:Flavone 3'-O-methyltransferase 1 [Citrus sinensis]|nr:Flavone 3'-O-methyltransferase 1 [Citrus sinensis]
MELVNGSIPRITMKAAIKLGVLEILAKASPSQLTSSEIASQLPTNNKEAPIVLDRILRLLACHSFRNLVTNKDGSAPRSRSATTTLVRSRSVTTTLVRSRSVSNDLPGYDSGVNMSLIVNTYSQIRGINFDLPHVIENASSSPGVEHVGGDVFVKIPNGQAIFMKFILHDWSDEQYLKILKNCYDALPESGKVIIVESIVPESSQISSVEHVEGDMFVNVPSGQAIFTKNASQHIDRVMNAQSSQQILQNRLWLQTSIEAVKWLAKQACAFRGHDESIKSSNSGNFIKMIKYSARMNKDIVDAVLENASGSAKYTSSDIQKELLNIISNRVWQKIREEIGDAKFCILVDEAQD